jgi:hypothetical protein
LFCLPIHLSAWNNSAPAGRMIVNVDMWVFFENVWRKFKFHSYLTTIMSTLHEDTWKFISCSIPFRIRNVAEKTQSKKSKHIEVASVYWQADTTWITAIKEHMITYIVWNTGWYSVVRLTMGWMVQGIKSWWGQDFPYSSRLAVVPPSFLYNGYQVCFPEVKRPDHGLYHPSHLLMRLKKE